MQINDRQYEALCAVCDTLIPSVAKEEDPTGYWQRNASDLGIPDKVLESFSARPAFDQTVFKLLLDLFSSSLLGLTYFGGIKPVFDLSEDERERLLQRWSGSMLPPLRMAFEGLRRQVVFYFYGTSKGGENPSWVDMGYPGPLAEPPTLKERPIKPLVIDGPTVLRCDVVVVGSGAGGGVVAGELAEAGHDVIVVEKGLYVAEDDMDQREVPMIEKLYEQKGFVTTADLGVTLFAGSNLGGGTTVNWAGSFRTPDFVLQEWALEHQLPMVASKTFQEHYDAVSKAISVNTNGGSYNPQNQALRRATEALGYHCGDVPRNLLGCDTDEAQEAQGYSLLGCQQGHKQGTLKTYLQRAFDAGARIVPATEAHHIQNHHGTIQGIVATHTAADGKRHAVTIHANKVVVAAGGLHTPGLLMRSGFSHPQLGRNLYLHPAVVVSARYGQTMNSWSGLMMSAYTDEFGRISGNYGVKIETPPVHPGLLATSIPWSSGIQHKERMMEAAKLGHFVIFARDMEGGRVFLDHQGTVRTLYKLGKRDLNHLQIGIANAAHMHLEAGAQGAYIPHNDAAEIRGDKGTPSREAILEAVRKLRWDLNRFPLYSAHQMGSCRMGGNANTHPVAPDGAFRGVKGLYVADASVFPAACGTNPMLTIMAFAHHIAQGLK